LRRRSVWRMECLIKNPKLWWPYGYGEPNVYDTVVELLDGDVVVDRRQLNVGLRKLRLKRTESLADPNACFQFEINGEDIMCKGSNWVPMCAYHSQDAQRYPKAMELVSDIGCNMLRVWGGGVYEQEYFYDYCDRHGIMVWQDFMMACQLLPMEDELMRNVENEATYIVKALRHHPSIVLWAGDNELDQALTSANIDPAVNRYTRELLPRVLSKHDSYRPYLPSSPYICSKNFEIMRDGGPNLSPENHLWGARDYYKADFYSQSPACFISETGYHGCPDPASVYQMVDEGYAWPCNNEQWTLHSSDQKGNDGRVQLMVKQIRQLFGMEAKDLEEFALASQISQAEAKKFFIEHTRMGRPHKSGILWWNLLDGWPQMSDAVVDYYYCKKLAYDYIKRSQAPFAMMMDELADWKYTLKAANDTLETVAGTYIVTDMETDEVLSEGEFTAKPNHVTPIAKIPIYYSEQRMLLIRWTVNGQTCYNHYMCGFPPFSFEKYKGWLQKLEALESCII
ncbi:MAG: glycoside hydrolase family 2, partial [Firmicutes bacterium]|nr:glycoside hydrolase family 2 [Bacillota bacterium]